MTDTLTDQQAPHRSARLLTIPNVLCAVRLIGSGVLVVLALGEQHRAFLWLFIALAATDWVDGKLAIMLNQRSVFGARLDSWADASLYAALAFGALWLHPQTLRAESIWIAAAILSYIIATATGFLRFGRWPSHHTRSAKISWLLITVGAISLLLGWSLWPLRVALAAVTLTNIESVLITLSLPEWRADVRSLWHVRRSLKQPLPHPDEPPR